MYTYTATLVSVVDGDTVKLDIDCGFRIWRRAERYRLARINAPEIATPEGVTAKAALVGKLPPTFLVTTTKADNYGRYLVEIILPDGTNVNNWLMTNGFAIPYGT